MPRVADVVSVLTQYEKRYRFLDVFADDLEDLKEVQWIGTEATFRANVGGRTLVAQNLEGGVLRLSLEAGGALEGALVVGALGAMIGAASKTKDGALAGLALGMLVGALAGSGQSNNPDMNRIMALRFEPLQRQWVLYDGALLPWAKDHLLPTGS